MPAPTFYTLELQFRSDEENLVLPTPLIQGLLSDPNEAAAREALWKFFSPYRSQTERPLVHDKRWLVELIKWRPKEGLSPKDGFSRKSLRVAIKALKEDREGSFIITTTQAKVLWEIVKNPDFKLSVISDAFLDFMEMFCEVTGYKFDDLAKDPDLEALQKMEGLDKLEASLIQPSAEREDGQRAPLPV